MAEPRQEATGRPGRKERDFGARWPCHVWARGCTRPSLGVPVCTRGSLRMAERGSRDGGPVGTGHVEGVLPAKTSGRCLDSQEMHPFPPPPTPYAHTPALSSCSLSSQPRGLALTLSERDPQGEFPIGAKPEPVSLAPRGLPAGLTLLATPAPCPALSTPRPTPHPKCSQVRAPDKSPCFSPRGASSWENSSFPATPPSLPPSPFPPGGSPLCLSIAPVPSPEGDCLEGGVHA